MKFPDVINLVLSHTPVDIRDAFKNQLLKIGHNALFPNAADTIARALIKGIDEVVAACVKTLGKGDSQAIIAAYQNSLQGELQELIDATIAYAPKALAVELAKATYGNNSKEANAARAERAVFMADLRSEVSDLLESVTGGTPAD